MHIYWKKYLRISGPAQFKSVLFKSQLYFPVEPIYGLLVKYGISNTS